MPPSKVLLVLDEVPHPNYSGTGVTATALVESLIKNGYLVHILALDKANNNIGDSENYWNNLGVCVDILDFKTPGNIFSKYIHKVFMHPKYLFSGTNQKNDLLEFVESNGVDIIVGYHWNAAAAACDISIPKYFLVGDPVHLPILFAHKMYKKYQDGYLSFEYIKRLFVKLLVRKYVNGMVYLLNSADSSRAFAAHHAKQLRVDGALNCLYMHTPVNDPLINKPIANKGKDLKILHIGHLKGTATLSGVELIADEILPYLKRKVKTPFELHFVGAFYKTIPVLLREKLKCNEVLFRGQITPPDYEFLSSHCLLVATPIELGIRVRIITALSFGCVVVAHTANTKGIPELEHGYNCLLADTGKELAKHCIMIYENERLRSELEKNSRTTYESHFSPEAVGHELVKMLNLKII